MKLYCFTCGKELTDKDIIIKELIYNEEHNDNDVVFVCEECYNQEEKENED